VRFTPEADAAVAAAAGLDPDFRGVVHPLKVDGWRKGPGGPLLHIPENYFLWCFFFAVTVICSARDFDPLAPLTTTLNL
jgi:hypothetical protein